MRPSGGLIDLLLADGIIGLLEAEKDWLSLPEASICPTTVESCLSIFYKAINCQGKRQQLLIN